MKKRTLLFTCLFISYISFTQTVLWQEDFEGTPDFTLNSTDESSTAAGENPWVVNNIYAGGSGTFICLGFSFPFTVPAAANQPAGISNGPTSQYLHVTPQIAINSGGSVPAASYVAADGVCILGGQNTFSRMSSDINTTGYDSISLDLWWMCGGSTLYYGELYYSTDGGSVWTSVINPTTGTNEWRDEVSWVNDQITNSNWHGQSTLRFGFRFVTGTSTTGSELDPGFAIDDITVTGFNNCVNTSNNLTESACDEFISPSGIYTWTTTGIYNDTIPNAGGCDSVLTVDLTINTVDNNVTQSGSNLMSDQAAATYQWLDCDNALVPVSGAVSQSYDATTNGNYAVIITSNGCVDTSNCYTVEGIGFEGLSFEDISIFPNPTEGNFFINLGKSELTADVRITNVEGKVVFASKVQANTPIELQGEKGVYIVEVKIGELRQFFRLVKTQ